jgi:hypothetical protein
MRPASCHQHWRSKLACFRRLRRFNLLSFYTAMVAMPVGFALVVLTDVEWLGGFFFVLGAALIALLSGEAYLVLPFLACPRCGNPFFIPRGWRGLIYIVNPHTRSCIHCGLDMREADGVSEM